MLIYEYRRSFNTPGCVDKLNTAGRKLYTARVLAIFNLSVRPCYMYKTGDIKKKYSML